MPFMCIYYPTMPCKDLKEFEKGEMKCPDSTCKLHLDDLADNNPVSTPPQNDTQRKDC